MDFRIVTEKLITAFRKEDVRYAFMGGYALGLWGVGRTTVDIDLLINLDDLNKVDDIMLKLGYECKHRSENVSQYVSSLKIMGEVDFLHAFRDASLEMIGRAEEKEIFGGVLKIKVARPEDLIGLKLQALKNNPSRSQTDMADIESLMSIHGKNLDWSLIEEYFKLFNMGDVYKKLKGDIK
jgi:hypothetical protein